MAPPTYIARQNPSDLWGVGYRLLGDEEALRRSLAHLQATEFLYEARLFPELEYAFKHTLLHDVAYMSLLERQRVWCARPLWWPDSGIHSTTRRLWCQ